MPGVKAVRLTLERQALASANGVTRGALLRGVRTEDLLSREIIAKNVVHGEFGAFDTRPGVVIGERLRQALNLRAGDKITIVTHGLNENGSIAPRYTDYEVLASFLTKRYEFDNTLVFMPLQMLQEDLEYDRKKVSSIDLELADAAAAPKVAEEIRKRDHTLTGFKIVRLSLLYAGSPSRLSRRFFGPTLESPRTCTQRKRP